MAKLKIVLATRNRDKIKEIKNVFKDMDIEFLTLDDFKGFPEVIEDGKTLLENALKKAREISKFFNMPALSDDTGLEVEYLGGAPGVYSARYAGENATYEDNVNKLLKELEGVEWDKRKAVFKTIVALVFPDGREFVAEGANEGHITTEKIGTEGFGYDPIFYVDEKGKTYAEMSLEEKNSISHRARALINLKKIIESELF